MVALGAVLGLIIAQLVLVCGVGSIVDSSTKTLIVGKSIHSLCMVSHIYNLLIFMSETVIFMILTAILVLFAERIIISISTAVVGATSMTIGIDLFAHTGLIEIMTVSVQYSFPALNSIPTEVWVLLGATVMFAGLGMWIQLHPQVLYHPMWDRRAGAWRGYPTMYAGRSPYEVYDRQMQMEMPIQMPVSAPPMPIGANVPMSMEPGLPLEGNRPKWTRWWGPGQKIMTGMR